MLLNSPIPANEADRVTKLVDYDLDYSDLQANFRDLTKLAAKIAGTEVSLINLIDSFTQWSVAQHGLPIEQMPREDSVCQYTIMGEDSFEVPDLSTDERFKDKAYVTHAPKLRYYFGVPIRSSDGLALGALCVMDKVGKEISPEKVEMLKIIAEEVVNRFNAIRVIKKLRSSVQEAHDTRRKVAHDIRGPLGGIINLAQLISMQGEQNKMDEVLEFIKLIQRSSSSLLELADEILSAEKKAAMPTDMPRDVQDHELNLVSFKEKLERLYLPQALQKKIEFTVTTSQQSEYQPFYKNKLLQIAGNLISNAIKFTPEKGKVSVMLDLVPAGKDFKLLIRITDTGIGMTQEQVDNILAGQAVLSNGTQGEIGYGFGLSLVKHLIDSLNGVLSIDSQPGMGTRFEVSLPQKKI
ncbi:MAG TPA: GAF domain-containing sensor histidine kinase [Sediminibacterium sp.]|nr:GAF domain-containing sensor histidine kinase [Sediminibacterium sp.]